MCAVGDFDHSRGVVALCADRDTHGLVFGGPRLQHALVLRAIVRIDVRRERRSVNCFVSQRRPSIGVSSGVRQPTVSQDEEVGVGAASSESPGE